MHTFTELSSAASSCRVVLTQVWGERGRGEGGEGKRGRGGAVGLVSTEVMAYSV